MLLRSDPAQYRNTHANDRASRLVASPLGSARSANDDKDKPGGTGSGGPGGKNDTATITRPKTRSKRPNLYRVLLLNDDYTPMEFVVLILQDVFNKTREDAMRVMLHVHNHGVGECGIYPYEVAETKVTRVMDAARKSQHPLQCVMEKQ